jgi:eukaryotic-like serine/threonine-protein kinase
MHDVVARFTSTLSANHMNTGIARIKLGRTLVKQRKWPAVITESGAGYDILVKEKSQQQVWLEMARQDLAAAYAGVGDSTSSSRFSSELAAMHNAP